MDLVYLDHSQLYSICIPLGMRSQIVSHDEYSILLQTNVDSIVWSQLAQLTNIIISPLLFVTKISSQ